MPIWILSFRDGHNIHSPLTLAITDHLKPASTNLPCESVLTIFRQGRMGGVRKPGDETSESQHAWVDVRIPNVYDVTRYN